MITPHYYAITHLTLYEYSEPVSDSVMELRMQPRSDGWQRCARFVLDISPTAHVQHYRDYAGNIIHTFDIPMPHRQLAIKAEAVVELREHQLVLDALPWEAWDQLDTNVQNDHDLYDMLLPGNFTQQTDLLTPFAREIGWGRTNDPLTLMRELNTAIYQHFEYRQNVTKADSPIDIGPGIAAWCLPGFHPHYDYPGAYHRYPLSLCQRLPVPSNWWTGSLRRGGDPCLG